MNLAENIVVLTLNQTGIDVNTCVLFSKHYKGNLCATFMCSDLLSMRTNQQTLAHSAHHCLPSFLFFIPPLLTIVFLPFFSLSLLFSLPFLSLSLPHLPSSLKPSNFLPQKVMKLTKHIITYQVTNNDCIELVDRKYVLEDTYPHKNFLLFDKEFCA